MQGHINEIVEVLSLAATPTDRNHRQALARVEALRQLPDYFTCCATVLSSPQMAHQIRLQAAFQLKNNVANPAFAASPSVLDAVLQCVADSEPGVRRAASSIVSAATRDGIWSAAAVVPSLVSSLQAAGFQNPGAAHGCVLAISQIVEDAIQLLEMQNLVGGVVSALCPCVLYEGNEKIRLNALIAFSVFLEQAGIEVNGASAAALRPVIVQLMDCFFKNLDNPMSADISEKAIKCLVLSLAFHDQIDDSLFFRLAQTMLQATSVSADTMETLRTEATEFWRSVLYFPRFAELVFPAMNQIVPLLVDGMEYSKMELGMLQANANDAIVPDRLEDIKPRHYEARTQSTADDDDADDGDDEVEEWNLRRVSASVLDDIAEYFGDRVLPVTLQVIDSKMQPSRDWRHLEAAILALGAIAEGCFDGLRPYLDLITERLLGILEDASSHFLVVNIATWSLRRLAQYLLETVDASGNLVKLQRYLRCNFQLMQSQSKLVQEASCSAMTDICDQADDNQLDTYLQPLAQTINTCLTNFQLKNRLLLFELIESVCRRFESRIADPSIVSLITGPLITIWQQTPNDSPMLFSVFTCMSSVCTALGPHVQPMAKDIFDRAYGVLYHYMNARQTALASGEDPPEFEFIVTSADLLSGLFDALGSSLEPLVAANQPTFVQMCLAAITDTLHEIRQSGFSLLGDLSKASPGYVQDCLPQLLQAIIQNCQQVDDVTAGCVSNAAWCLQQLLEHQQDITQGRPLLQGQHIDAMFGQFAKVLIDTELTSDMKNMAENIILLLGNFMHAEPDVVTRVGLPLQAVIRRWLEYARNIRKVTSRENAARGLLLALQREPQVLCEHLHVFFDYCNSLTDGPVDVKKAIVQILTAVRQGAPQQWSASVAQYSPQLMNKLFVAYSVR